MLEAVETDICRRLSKQVGKKDHLESTKFDLSTNCDSWNGVFENDSSTDQQIDILPPKHIQLFTMVDYVWTVDTA
ncbi:hypothetical protein M8J76_015780 [Diaphorina citri]|nr:hypothetical protein M8J76_015780 [Diaphorina citri]